MIFSYLARGITFFLQQILFKVLNATFCVGSIIIAKGNPKEIYYLMQYKEDKIRVENELSKYERKLCVSSKYKKEKAAAAAARAMEWSERMNWANTYK